MSFRSVKMNYFDVTMSQEAGWHFAEEIGALKLVHFMDANKNVPAKDRYFTDPLRRCDAVETRLNEIERMCIEFNKEIIYTDESKEYLEQLKAELAKREEYDKKAMHTLFTEVEDIVAGKHNTITELYYNHSVLTSKRFAACEFYNLLKELQPVLPADLNAYQSAVDDTDGNINRFRGVQFFYLAGVVRTEDVYKLQRLTFRLSRGNAFLHTTDLTFENAEPLLNFNYGTKKSAFFLVFQLGTTELLKQRLRKALESLNASFYTLPGGIREVEDMMVALLDSVRTNETVIAKSAYYLDGELAHFYAPTERINLSVIEQYRIILEKERAITEIMNRMQLKNGLLRGKLWVPEEQVNYLKSFIGNLRNSGYRLNIELNYADFEARHYKPPTYIKLNDLSAPFQQIVNTYGVPRYREVNPGLFTIISFPYEFGVMYGDIGHGGIILAFGLCLVYYYNQLYATALKPVLPYRYMLTLLGLFATYCGLVYNDFLAIPWAIFGSCYRFEHHTFVRKYPECTVPFGFDPVWYRSAQEVSFLNSFKMKLSIIIGVVHMSLGIFCKAMNSVHFSNYVDLFFEFLPQLLFFWATFGYMCVAMIIKWYKDWGDGSNAPSIIAIFIGGGAAEPGNVLWGDAEGVTQTAVQRSLFALAGICVIWMLLPKPIILAVKAKLNRSKGQPSKEHVRDLKEKFLDEDNRNFSRPSGHGEEEDPNAEEVHEEHDFSEIIVHQLIEVIEFVLGSVSNTASYLRLWALSLAHGQLAKVFITMTVLQPLLDGNVLGAMAGFPVFVAATFAVILMMDTMECFLHTLRLHWVEFQNKFYKGDGYLFEPFDFVGIVDEQTAKKKSDRMKTLA